MNEERTIDMTYPIHTCLFTALQFHGRKLLSLALNGEWLWFEYHLNISFPTLIQEYRQSMVVTAFEIEYTASFEFFDANQFTVSVTKVRVRQKDTVLELHYEFSANNVTFSRVMICFRLLVLFGDEALTAQSGKIDEKLLQRFLPEEIDSSNMVRAVPKLLSKIEAEGQFITEHSHLFTLYRYQCEVADQWSFIELPTFASAGRERLIISLDDDPAELSRTMGKPIKSIVAKLSCPFFLFDEGRVRTRAYLLNKQPIFVHHVFNISRADSLAAIVIESF